MSKTTRVLVVCAVTALVVAAVMPTLEARAPVPVIGENDVRRLIDDLGHRDEARRERAYEKLVEIGAPIMTHPRLLESIRDWRGTAHTHRLLDSLQRRHGMPSIVVNGTRFCAKTESLWVGKAGYQGSRPSISLKFSNGSTTPACYMLKGIPSVELRTVSGEWLPIKHKPNLRMPMNIGTEAVQPGTSIEYSGFHVEISDDESGKLLVIHGTNDVKHEYMSGAFKPGRYYLVVKYEYQLTPGDEWNPHPPKGATIWEGIVRTPPIAITIR